MRLLPDTETPAAAVQTTASPEEGGGGTVDPVPIIAFVKVAPFE
jgi:hypothetical protein